MTVRWTVRAATGFPSEKQIPPEATIKEPGIVQTLLELLKRCAESHSFDTGDPDNSAVLDQRFCAYQDSYETDPPEIKDGFKELDAYLRQLSLDDNNAVWNLCCRICTAYEHKAFIDGFHYGAQLMIELK